MPLRYDIAATLVLTAVNVTLGNAAEDIEQNPSRQQSTAAPEFSSPTDSDDALDAILRGFDGNPADHQATSNPQPEVTDTQDATQTTAWRLSGYSNISAAYNYAHDAPSAGATDYRGWSRLRCKLAPELAFQPVNADWRIFTSASLFYDAIYDARGRNHYTDGVLDDYGQEIELRDTYLQASPFPSIDIKIGNQILAWGTSDNIRVVDLINPLDNREPGMVDIEDLRIPLLMTRADYFLGSWRFTGAMIHEVRFDKNPPYGSDFYPASTAPPPEQRTGNSTDNQEYALSASGTFSGWDFSLHWARLFDDQAHVAIGTAGPVLQHSRLTLRGLTADWALGNWLLKTELAYISGLQFFASGAQRFTRWDAMGGVDYSGLQDATLTLEVANRHVNDYDKALANAIDRVDADSLQTMLRYQESYFSERLNLLLLWGLFGDSGKEGGFSRASISYELTPGTSLLAGVVTYQGGDSPLFKAVADNDRVFSELRHDF